MSKKVAFPRFKCRECPNLLCVGSALTPTYYCDGFGKKKPKRFPRKGPTYPPAWCPKLISPPVCRIYDFIDEQNRFMDLILRENWEAHPRGYIYPERRRYEVKAVINLNLTAKQMFEAVKEEYLRDVIPDIEFQGGEIIEINDGLRPYRFYVYSDALLIPVVSYSWEK